MPARRRALVGLAAWSVAAGLLAACGRKGDLVLPEEETPPDAGGAGEPSPGPGTGTAG